MHRKGSAQTLFCVQLASATSANITRQNTCNPAARRQFELSHKRRSKVLPEANWLFALSHLLQSTNTSNNAYCEPTISPRRRPNQKLLFARSAKRLLGPSHMSRLNPIPLPVSSRSLLRARKLVAQPKVVAPIGESLASCSTKSLFNATGSLMQLCLSHAETALPSGDNIMRPRFPSLALLIGSVPI